MKPYQRNHTLQSGKRRFVAICLDYAGIVVRVDCLNLPGMYRVLIYGRDPTLLETRKWILERAGYRVAAVADLAAAEAILSTEGPDLCILCHTLSAELRERALKIAHGQRPDMRNLILSHGNFEGPVRDTDLVFYVFEGPGAMIATANRILGRSAGVSS